MKGTPLIAGEGALLLLFPRGERPTTDVLGDSLFSTAQIIQSGVIAESSGRGPVEGIELLRDGMTYDLLGAAPGVSVEVPIFRHRLGLPGDVHENELEALLLRPGPHLAQGGHTIPVVRTMMNVAAMVVAHLPGLRALAWPAAGTLIGPDFFVSSMTSWIAGGAFPALGLTAFAVDPDGGLRSEGLAFFTGQELRLDPDLSEDRAAGTRLGIRLVNQLAGQGRLTAAEAIIGPAGERLTLAPSVGGRLVCVRRG